MANKAMPTEKIPIPVLKSISTSVGIAIAKYIKLAVDVPFMEKVLAKPKGSFDPELANIFRKNIDEKIKPALENELDSNLIEDKTDSLKFDKIFKIFELFAKERSLALTLLVGTYNRKSRYVHHIPNLMDGKKDNENIYVKPVHAVPQFFYNYELYVPITYKKPQDITQEDSKSYLKDNWNLIIDKMPKKMKEKLILTLTPKYTIKRVYGWDGAWIVYDAAVVDTGDFWSVPLVNTPFNGKQPFVCYREGEAVVVANDGIEKSQNIVKENIEEMRNRVRQNRNIWFEEQRIVDFNPTWLVASKTANVDEKSITYQNITESVQELSSNVGSATIDKNLPSKERELFEYMKREPFGKPFYVFTKDDIGNCKIINKERLRKLYV